jgi:hypothetical protein
MPLLYRNPDVFDVREPALFTYAPRQDMEYWGAGTKVVFSPRNQLRAMGENLAVLFVDPHILPMSGLLVGGLIFSLVSTSRARRLRNILRSWPLLVPGVAGLCMYLLLSVEPRYVAPFLVLVLLGLFPGILVQGPANSVQRTATSAAVIAASLVVFAGLLVVYHLAGFPRGESGRLFLQVGKALNREGVRPGEDVAIIGDSSDGCRWARMARVRIVAQILREDVADFWQMKDPHVQAEVFDAFMRAGAEAVVAEQTPPPDKLSDWRRLGNTDYYVHILTPSRAN